MNDLSIGANVKHRTRNFEGVVAAIVSMPLLRMMDKKVIVRVGSVPGGALRHCWASDLELLDAPQKSDIWAVKPDMPAYRAGGRQVRPGLVVYDGGRR